MSQSGETPHAPSSGNGQALSIPSDDVVALTRYADLPPGSAADLLRPLLTNFVSGIRSQPRQSLLESEIALTFDPSWED
jgi:hypothetical protein